eukprot:Plantae.Rhodophyta-Purpureofilum_apyrenoidigerum.ctg24536.p1 GENE.Plantae.Rhodophyta-Purpureofilum_apyrenoidigerum.ctg24536~~Plantae.Rhodophyta-Purpureofilum_apyrenoidigerum.ctg24536.p1  ORF type:complete len:101 (-),score=3.49 Plantae.Rhodophyta-Purpureofilum_apyrenoidigerum.ctg24536:110-412(-)
MAMMRSCRTRYQHHVEHLGSAAVQPCSCHFPGYAVSNGVNVLIRQCVIFSLLSTFSAVYQHGEVLGHDTGLDGLNTRFFEVLGKHLQVAVTVQLSAMFQS